MKCSQIGLLGFKLVVTAVLLWLLLIETDLKLVFSSLHAMHPLWATAAITVLIMQLSLSSLRWYLTGRLISTHLAIKQAIRLTMIGQFFNQVLPSSLGGDAVRAWLAHREGIPLARGVASILCDRATALLVLTIIVLMTLSLYRLLGGGDIPATRILLTILPLGTAGGLLILFFRGNEIAMFMMKFRFFLPVGVLIRDLRAVLFTSIYSLMIFALAATVQSMLVLVIYFCARGINVDLGSGLLLIPAILLVSAVPISFGGWGVREGAMVIGLGFAQVPATDALATSLAFGLAQIIAGLPGGVMWLIMRTEARHRDKLARGFSTDTATVFSAADTQANENTK